MFNKALQYFVRYQQLLLQTAIKKSFFSTWNLKTPDLFHRFRILDSGIYINVC